MTADPSTKPLPRPKRLKVRLKHNALDNIEAYQALEGAVVQSVTGSSIHVTPGTWVILRSGAIVDTLTQKHFDQMYEPVPDEGLQIAPQDQATLAQILGFGSTSSSAQLTAAVRKLASCSVGKVDVDFTPAQWEELSHRAKKRGQTVEEYVRRLVEKFFQDVWTTAV